MSRISAVKSTVGAASAPSAPLYSMSFIAGVPTIVPGTHSTFRTSDGKSIQDIRGAAYAVGAKGRFSRVQRIDNYIVKHLKHHYSPDLALHEVQNLIKCIGNRQVVQILGAEIYSSEAFIIYNYVPGQTLHDYIHKKPPPTHSELMRRYAETSTAIQNLHELGLIHLDINPNNVWVPDDPRQPTILLDLGSMHEIGEERTVVTGTPGYYPPLGNIAIADPKLNLYAMESILSKYPTPFPKPVAPDTPFNMTNVHELNGGKRRRKSRKTNRKKRTSRKRRV